MLISMAAENQKADGVVRVIAVNTVAMYGAMIIISYKYYIIAIINHQWLIIMTWHTGTCVCVCAFTSWPH